MIVICTTSLQLISLVISGCMPLHSLKVFFRINQSFAIRIEENMVATLCFSHGILIVMSQLPEELGSLETSITTLSVDLGTLSLQYVAAEM